MKIDPGKLKIIPFQALISYTSTQGNKLLRIISQKQKTTDQQEVAEKQANVKLLACRALQQQATYAHKGDFSKSNTVSEQWDSYLNTNIMRNTEDKSSSKEVMHKFKERQSKVSSTVNSKSSRVSKAMKSPFDKDLHSIEEKSSTMEITQSTGNKNLSIPIPKSLPNPQPMKSNYQAPVKKSVVTTSKTVSMSSSKPQPSMLKMPPPKPMMKKELKQPEPKADDDDDEDHEYEILHKTKNINSDF